MSAVSLEQQLLHDYLTPLRIKVSWLMWARPWWWWQNLRQLHDQGVLTLAEVALFSRMISALLAAEFSFFEAVKVCAATASNRRVRTAAGEVVAAMSTGILPADAFCGGGRRWPEIMSLVVNTANNAHCLADSLRQLALACETEMNYRAEMRRGVLVPLLTGGGACLVLGWAVTVCASQEQSVAVSQLIMGASWLARYGLEVAAVSCVLLMVAWRSVVLSVRLERARDLLLLHLPFVGPLIARAYGALFFLLLALLLDAGVPVTEAVRALSSFFANAYWRHVLQTLVADLTAGGLLRDAVARMPRVCIPAFFVAVLSTVSDARSLAAVCRNTATVLTQERAALINRYILLLPPLLLTAAGVVIAVFLYIVLQMFSSSMSGVGM